MFHQSQIFFRKLLKQGNKPYSSWAFWWMLDSWGEGKRNETLPRPKKLLAVSNKPKIIPIGHVTGWWSHQKP